MKIRLLLRLSATTRPAPVQLSVGAITRWRSWILGLGCVVAGLRVVDTNTFPRTPGAFPVVPIFMNNEKASDTILEEAKNEKGC
jgi:hypothetical protein